MIKVITYGTYDLLHEGHINLLKRAKALGDYLVVGVTTENFDITRGKINVQQSLMERIEAVKNLGIADEVFPEEYLGQKIDDIKRYNIDIFAVGSDWEGHFDYLNEYCKVVYLPRTEGISSSQIRSTNTINVGVIGLDPAIKNMVNESKFVNGIEFCSIFYGENTNLKYFDEDKVCKSFDELINKVDAVYVATRPEERYTYVKKALLKNKHVICESPIALEEKQAFELIDIAKQRKLVLFDSIKTAYSLAFSRMVLLIKGGIIGDIKSIDVTCTRLDIQEWLIDTKYYGSKTGWGAIALLPVLKILGIDYKNLHSVTLNSNKLDDIYSKINMDYGDSLATINLGIGVKSEGDLRISGTKGYIYVPAPWWKSSYFEVRFEDLQNNQPYYYQSDGGGLRMELVHFVRCVKSFQDSFYVENKITIAIAKIMEEILK